MNLIKRNSVFPSLLSEILNTDWYGGLESESNSYPPVNIKEDEKDFTLELMVPGRNKDEFKIEIDKNILTVSVTDEEKDTEAKSKYSLKEYNIKGFKRTFSLPDTINDATIEAGYDNGILKFTLPKKEEALPKPKRLLEVS